MKATTTSHEATLDFWGDAKAAVEPVLEGLLKRAEEMGTIHLAMAYAARGGKRLRSTLLLEVARLFNVPKSQAVMVSAAIELIHSYSLVHDDLPAMDNADTRRGYPSCWRQFDEATAILAGDGLLTLAFEVLTAPEVHLNPEIRLELIRELAKASGSQGMIGGQMLDIEGSQDVERLRSLKTGTLISFSCEAAAILAQARIEERQALNAYGQDLGMLYQLTDDLLDLYGDPQKMGKPTGQDAHKTTVISLQGVKKVQHQISSLHARIQDHLALFGKKAERLLQIAVWVSNRCA